MGKPAAKKGDRVVAIDVHIVMVPSPAGPVPTPLPHPFSGTLDDGLSSDVEIEGKPAAVVGSTATNSPSHVPTPPGTAFQKPPKNQAEVKAGSSTVFINNKAAARAGDPVESCADPAPSPGANLIAVGTVEIG